MAGTPPIVGRFREVYRSSPAPHVWRAPGRVNLIGEHTDYNLGFVLPMAIGLECQVAAAPTNDGYLHAYSEQLGQAALWHVSEIADARPRGDWSDRVIGIAWELARRGVAIEPANILISSTVPLGGGLSSSAALGVSMTLALGGPRDPLELARLAHAAEVDFAGVPCGIMDQFVSANGQAGAAILLDCRSLDWRAVHLPENLAILAVNSMVRHELGDSAYRTRVAECSSAARALGLASLRDASVEHLALLEGALKKRARHVITEQMRVAAFVQAAARGDVGEMGRLITECHCSLRDDYEVSCAEIDFLVETALGIPGVFGARLIGGGFGGSMIALVRPEIVDTVDSALADRYREQWHLTPEIHLCTPAAGASQIF